MLNVSAYKLCHKVLINLIKHKKKYGINEVSVANHNFLEDR